MTNRVLPLHHDSPLTKYIIDILPEHFRIHVNKTNSHFAIITLPADFSLYYITLCYIHWHYIK